MAIENDEDRAIFFDIDDFGVSATITLQDSTILVVEGIFDSPHLTRGLRQNNQFSFSQGADVSGDVPQFRCRTSDAPGVKTGRATLLVNGVSYLAYDVQPDGTGITTIRMKRA